MLNNIVYRVLENVDDLEAAVNLEISVWGLSPLDAAPVNVLRALGHAGGATMGAYVADRLIGISLCFPAITDDRRLILWSHMTGVHRDYQSSGIGFGIKAYQRHWALLHGYDEMRWTFDPLQRGNANFNMHRLGATANLYHNNFYGVMQDEINHADLPSDRIEAVWRLNDDDVIRRLSNIFPPLPDAPYLLRDEDGVPRPAPLDERQSTYLVQIPPSQSALGDALGTWRYALREALTTAFAHGYVALDFTPQNAYLLRRNI